MLLDSEGAADLLNNVKRLGEDQYELIYEQIEKIKKTVEDQTNLVDVLQKKLLFVLRKREPLKKKKPNNRKVSYSQTTLK